MYFQPQYFHPGMGGTYCAPQPQPIYAAPGFHYPAHPTVIPMPMATAAPMGYQMSQPQCY